MSELLPEALRRLGGRGAAEDEEGGFVAYLPDLEEVESFVEEARREMESFTGTSSLDLSWRWQEHEEWEETWRRGFQPRRVTERLVVSPSWVDPKPGPGELVITLDPGVAFGTGEHPTTRGSLRLLDRVVEPGTRWADVGAGSGILAIALARLGASHVLAVEPDPLACTAAAENLSTNGVEAVVELLHAQATPDLLDRVGPFDGIASNIECGVILSLLGAYRRALAPEGELVVSGILHHEVEGFLQEARRLGLHLTDEDREEEWWSGHLRIQD